MATIDYTSPGLSVTQGNIVLMSVATADVPPDSLVYGRTVAIGAPLQWTSTAQRDGGGTGTVVVNSQGVCTITPDVGNDRFYGNFEIVFTFDGGASESKFVVHDGEADLRSTYFTAHPQDAEGYTIIPTPDAVDSLIYYFDPDYVGGGIPKGYLLNDTEVAGAWQNPLGAIVPYTNADLPFPLAREGKADYYLFKKGTTTTITNFIIKHFNNGKSATQPHVVAYYGTDPARPIIDMDPRTNPKYTAMFNNAADSQFNHYYGLEFTSTWFNPAEGNFLGWEYLRANEVYLYPCMITSGTTAAPDLAGFVVEDCHFHHISGGAAATNGGQENDVQIRRNIYEWIYNAYDFASGHFCTNASILLEDNLYYHCGWYRQAYTGSGSGLQFTGLATSGSTITCTHTGAFTGESLESVVITDTDNGGTGRISSNTNDTVTFTFLSGTIDFTGGGNYQIGGLSQTEQGQATLFNHSRYWSSVKNCLIKNNISIDPSSMHHKFTAEVTDRRTVGSITGATQASSCVITLAGHAVPSGGWVKVAAMPGEYAAFDGTQEDPATFWEVGAVTANTLELLGANSSAFAAYTSGGTLYDYTVGYNEEIGTEKTSNIIIKDELCVYGEIGHSIGGNEDNNLSTRFADIRKHNVIVYRLGENQPTGRVLAWTGGASDWDGGLIANTLDYNYISNTDVSNNQGIILTGIMVDTVASRNVVYDIHPAIAASVDPTSGNINAGRGANGHVSETATNCHIIGNILHNPSSDYAPAGLETDTYPASAGITWQGNKYWSTQASGNFWNIQDTLSNSTAWDTATSESGYTTTQVTFNDATRTVETYMQSKGKSATIDALVTEVKAMMKPGSWDKAYTAAEINAWIQEGFKEA